MTVYKLGPDEILLGYIVLTQNGGRMRVMAEVNGAINPSPERDRLVEAVRDAAERLSRAGAK